MIFVKFILWAVLLMSSASILGMALLVGMGAH
jgi:hypothetical protein